MGRVDMRPLRCIIQRLVYGGLYFLLQMYGFLWLRAGGTEHDEGWAIGSMARPPGSSLGALNLAAL
jgi:hypothetical protein